MANNPPVIVAEYALGAAALVFFGPKILGAIGGFFRGYSGEVSAPAVLDNVC